MPRAGRYRAPVAPPGEPHDHWSRPDLNRGLGLPTFEHTRRSGGRSPSVPAWARGVPGVLGVVAIVLLLGGVTVALVR